MSNRYKWIERNLRMNQIHVYGAFDASATDPYILPSGIGFSVTKLGTGYFNVSIDNYYSNASDITQIIYANGFCKDSSDKFYVKVFPETNGTLTVRTINTSNALADPDGDIAFKATILWSKTGN